MTTLDEMFDAQQGIYVRPAIVRAFGGDMPGVALLALIRYRMDGPHAIEHAGRQWVRMTWDDLCDGTGLNSSTVQRRLEALAELGALIRRQGLLDAHDRGYWYTLDLGWTPPGQGPIRAKRADGKSTSSNRAKREVDNRAKRPDDNHAERADVFLTKKIDKEKGEENTAHANVRVLEATDYEFDEFWSSYPKRNGAKAGKVNARKQWVRLKPHERVEARAALDRYSAAKNGYPEDAERYLRHKRWIGLEVETEAERDARMVEGALRFAEEMGMS